MCWRCCRGNRRSRRSTRTRCRGGSRNARPRGRASWRDEGRAWTTIWSSKAAR
jgi:hypothetical protein